MFYKNRENSETILGAGVIDPVSIYIKEKK